MSNHEPIHYYDDIGFDCNDVPVLIGDWVKCTLNWMPFTISEVYGIRHWSAQPESYQFLVEYSSGCRIWFHYKNLVKMHIENPITFKEIIPI